MSRGRVRAREERLDTCKQSYVATSLGRRPTYADGQRKGPAMCRFPFPILVLATTVLASCSADGFGSGGRPDPNAPPRGYEEFFTAGEHSYRHAYAFAGEPVRRGETSERFELREGDCGGSDCGQPRYRTEIRMLDETVRARVGEDIWYGWSFYNGNIPATTRDRSLRLVLGQWTMGGEARPILRFMQLGQGEGHWGACNPRICAGPETGRGDVALQLEDMRETLNWGDAENDGYVCRLFDLAETRGRWVDMVMTTNFSAGLDGYLKIWVDGTLKCDYSGPLVSRSSLGEGRRPSHRRGIFSSYTERWDDATGDAPKPTLVAFYDEFAVGRSRSEVDVAARERAGLDPES